jgi:hypothetical protein
MKKKCNIRDKKIKKITLFIYIIINLSVLSWSYSSEIQIPKESDWTFRGNALTKGGLGSWDVRLHGMISPCTVIKKDGKYFLYYLGADGDRGHPHNDRGPRHRALGVATSFDGIHFTKYKDNPIITYLPHKNEEEGIFSAAATLDENGNVVLYYAALDAGSSTSTSVHSDVRLAISSDGFNFDDKGNVISHTDSSIWGHGDEIFPVGTFHTSNRWYVYYIAKGYWASWDLGLAWGNSKNNLPNSKAVIKARNFNIIGGGDPIRLSSDKISLFILVDPSKKWKERIIEVRTISKSSPTLLSKPVETYKINKLNGHTTIFLDEEKRTWFMYQLNRLNKGNIIVKIAPMKLSSS